MYTHCRALSYFFPDIENLLKNQMHCNKHPGYRAGCSERNLCWCAHPSHRGTYCLQPATMAREWLLLHVPGDWQTVTMGTRGPGLCTAREGGEAGRLRFPSISSLADWHSLNGAFEASSSLIKAFASLRSDLWKPVINIESGSPAGYCARGINRCFVRGAPGRVWRCGVRGSVSAPLSLSLRLCPGIGREAVARWDVPVPLEPAPPALGGAVWDFTRQCGVAGSLRCL